MQKKVWMSAWLIVVFAVVPCLAGAPAWASANNSIGQGGDFTPPLELGQNRSPVHYIRPVQFPEGDSIVRGGEDATDDEQNDILVASRQETAIASQQETASPVIPPSDACLEISRVGRVGRLYLRIPRINGSCEVDRDKVGFYLNDPECKATVDCEDNLRSGIACRYPSPKDVDCDNEKATGPCIDVSDVEAAVNVICAPDNAACNECINWQTGSPYCIDYRTSSGWRLKYCILPNGQMCNWNTCCRDGVQSRECGY
ncbi:MAG: hypothetical protein PVG19_10355 [Desulfobacterales bacterium]|jgi:hypothetical protein